MPSRVLSKLTYSNVVSTLCLFLLLGGGAYAAIKLPKNSVGTKQIKNGAVTEAKLANGAVTGEKVQNGSLTGTQINASTLGTVPNSTHANTADQATKATTANEATSAESANNSGQLGGIGPTGFIQGSGTIVRGYESTSSAGTSILMTIPNIGEVRVDCFEGKNRIAFFPLLSGSLWFTSGGTTGYVHGENGTQLADQATASLITAQFANTTETATMFISGNPGATCTYAGQAIVQP